MDGTTDRLARFLTGATLDSLPAAAVHEARRCIIDGLGVALGGADHPSIDILLRYTNSIQSQPQAQVWGRSDRLPAELAALVNGQAEHVLDFDDTFLPHETVLHATVPILPGLLAVAEQRHLDGNALLRSFVLGFEAECRLALALGRAHYIGGWHVTGTAGPIGGAVGVGTLIGLDAKTLKYAIGIAVTHSGGVTAMFGSMSKAYHCGKAAEAGVRSALLAELGFDSAPEPLTHPQGYVNVPASDKAENRLTDELGRRWYILENGFKPYSSGVVTHPIIDAMAAFRADGLQAKDIARIDARVNPWVLQATGQREPSTGLEGKFSAYHCAAVGLLDGAGRPAQFTDERVRRQDAIDLRRKVRLEPDEGLLKEACQITVTLMDGSQREKTIEHATGTAENPMTDDQIADKFLDLARPVIGNRADQLLDQLWKLDQLSDAADLAPLLARQ